MDGLSKMHETQEQEEVVKLYGDKTLEVMRRSNSLQQIQNETDEGLMEEIEEIRDTTFIIERPQYEATLIEVINALEILANLDLDITPAQHMQSVLRIILAICIDFHTKIQIIHDSMMAMAKM